MAQVLITALANQHLPFVHACVGESYVSFCNWMHSTECLIGARKYHSMEWTGVASSAQVAHLSRRRNALSMLVSVIMCVFL
jgi:hypothetical protein